MNKMSDDYFTILYNEYMTFVYRIAFSYLKNKEDSENVIQEVFMKLYTTPPKDTSRIMNWLAIVTKNFCLNQLKKRKKEKEILSTMAKETQFINQSKGLVEKKDILFFLNKLSEKYAIVLKMFYLGEASIKVIAKNLKINESTVKKRLERGRKLLQEEFDKEMRL